MKKKYTHIFIDLDNTLWDFKKNSYLALEIAFKKFIDDKVAFRDFNREYTKNNTLLWQKYREKEIAKKELVTERFKRTCNNLSISFSDFEAMNNYYLEKMGIQKKLVNGAVELLKTFRDKKLNLFIITNGFTEVQHKKLVNSGISHFFEKVFISEEIHAPKPSKEIFEYAIKSANAPKKQSLMIGDDWESDIIGAVNTGIDSVYLNSKSMPEKLFFKKSNIYFSPQLQFINQLV